MREENIMEVKSQLPSGMIGISNLPIQRHRRISREGGNFTIMVVGESGSGKTTLINTLFATVLLGRKNTSETRILERTVRVEVVRVEVEEQGFPLRLTLIDTPGLGDYVNNDNCWSPIVQFIDSRHDDFLQNESTTKSEATEDLRVHVCLYFIQPTGRNLKHLDIRVMKELCTRVNLIPIISKADTLTRSELSAFKERVKSSLLYHKIDTYIPKPITDDEEEAAQVYDIVSSMPLAVIGSEELYNVDGKAVCGRRYSWGVAEVKNPNHCDFKKLRMILMRSHMYDLILSTNDVFYERYRIAKLTARGCNDGETEEEAARNLESVIREEEELRQQFTERVKAEETKFKQWEQRLHAKRDGLNKDLEQQHRRIKALEEETSNNVASSRSKK